MYCIILTGAFGEHSRRVVKGYRAALTLAVRWLASEGWVGYRVRRVN